MRLSRRDGPIIGFLRAGQPLSLGTPRSSDESVFATPPFPDAPSNGVLPPVEARRNQIPVFIPLRVRPDDIPGALATSEAKASDVVYGLYRELSATYDGPAFAFVTCNRARVLERRGPRMKVAAEYPAGELHGWVDTANPGERDDACDGPHEPHGYSVDMIPSRTTFERLSREGAALYLRVDDAGTTRCQTWKFVQAVGQDSAAFVHESEAVRIIRPYRISGSTLHLGSPRIRSASGDLLSSSIGDAFRIVDVGPFRLYVVDVSPDGSDDSRWLTYRTSAVEPWFTDRAACEADSTKPRRKAGELGALLDPAP